MVHFDISHPRRACCRTYHQQLEETQIVIRRESLAKIHVKTNRRINNPL